MSQALKLRATKQRSDLLLLMGGCLLCRYAEEGPEFIQKQSSTGWIRTSDTCIERRASFHQTTEARQVAYCDIRHTEVHHSCGWFCQCPRRFSSRNKHVLRHTSRSVENLTVPCDV